MIRYTRSWRRARDVGRQRVEGGHTLHERCGAAGLLDVSGKTGTLLNERHEVGVVVHDDLREAI